MLYNKDVKRRIIAFTLIFFSIFIYAQTARPSAPLETQAYRGQRTTGTGTNCYIQNITAQQSAEGLIIDVRFSSGVDPRSLNSSNIIINGKTVVTNKIGFNREGTVCRINASAKLPCSITVKNVRTPDGKVIPAYTKELK